jgi:hypothetical protein
MAPKYHVEIFESFGSASQSRCAHADRAGAAPSSSPPPSKRFGDAITTADSADETAP